MKNPSPIEHVVVLMMENRSFDHILGTLPNVNGVLAPNGKPNPALSNSAVPGNAASKKYEAGSPASYVIPTVDVGSSGFGGPGHSFADATIQLDHSAATAAAVPAPAPLDGFVSNYIRELSSGGRANPSDQEISEPMTSFTSAQLPVISQLATEFCVCDQWFSEIPGPTEPNRLFTHAATSAGLVDNEWSFPIAAQTIYQLLEQAGHDWAFFYFDLSDSSSFPAIKARATRIFKFSAFLQQASAGTLPAYSFLCPQYSDAKDGTRANSEHAPYDVRYGENLIADVYEALRGGPLWDKTLFVVTYDEHGGYYDHVSPPVGVSNPDGLTAPNAYVSQLAKQNPSKSGYLIKPNMHFDFTRLGLRVPAVLVSPWIAKGVVDSTLYQHTSIMATLRDIFGVGSLTKRDAAANSFASQLGKLTTPRTDAPATLTRPALPVANAADMQLPPTDRLKDLWPMLAQLDGHKDSGKVTEPPATRAAAADYIGERLAAHEEFHREQRRRARYHIEPDAKGGFGWSFYDDKGNMIATSTKEYSTPEHAQADIERMRELAPFARQTK